MFGNNSSIGNNQSSTSVNQKLADFLGKRSFGGRETRQDAAVNNSTTTKVGDRNVFGDGLKLGNNYADKEFWMMIDSKRSQESCPWYSPTLKRLQSELFILAPTLALWLETCD